jgi:hypothetical protein
MKRVLQGLAEHEKEREERRMKRVRMSFEGAIEEKGAAQKRGLADFFTLAGKEGEGNEERGGTQGRFYLCEGRKE